MSNLKLLRTILRLQSLKITHFRFLHRDTELHLAVKPYKNRCRDKPPVCCGFWEAPRPDGVQDFCPAFSPLRRLSRGGWTVLPPWESVFTGPLWTI